MRISILTSLLLGWLFLFCSCSSKSGSKTPPDAGVPVDPVEGEWIQHAHDAQRTSYTTHVVAPPWRLKWMYFNERVPEGDPGLPRNVQPVTGDGRVYLALGRWGVIALREEDGSTAWENGSLEGSAAATPAFDAATGSLFVTTTAGRLYQLHARTGEILRSYAFSPPQQRIAHIDGVAEGVVGALERAGFSFAPLLLEDAVVVSAKEEVIALSTRDLAVKWTYAAESDVQTPGAFSPAANAVVVATRDLHVHAIDAANGSRRWRVKPYAVENPSVDTEYLFSWPVIAEQHGLVLMRIRHAWQLSVRQWPATLSAMRDLLAQNPELETVAALRLSDGSKAFTALVGNGGYGDGDYMPMGSPPVIKRDGVHEVAYTIIRGRDVHDWRWDSNFGEMVLDDQTVPGLEAGDVRFIYYDPSGGDTPWPEPFLLTDEQPFVTMAGNYLFGAHWAAGHAMEITGRSAQVGSYQNPIPTRPLPQIVESSTTCQNDAHFCDVPLETDPPGRVYGPNGFYIRYGAGAFYDRHWSEYATWVVSNDTVYFRSCSGTLVALEHDDGAAKKSGRSLPEWAVSAAPEGGETEIDWTDARRHAGRMVRTHARVAKVIRNGKQVYWAFRTPHRGSLMAILSVQMDAALDVRPGTLVHLRGPLTWYQGDPVMDLRNPQAFFHIERGGDHAEK